MRSWGRIGIVALLLAGPAMADERIASTDVREVCAENGRPGSAYSRAHRVVMRRSVPGMILDHRIPLCVGGADVDANIQIQTKAAAADKDRLEWYACREVCRHHRLGLAEAQGFFTGDWRAAYTKVFGEVAR